MAANEIVSHTQTQDDDQRASCTTKGKGQPFMTWKKKLTALVVDHGMTCRMLEQGYMSAYGVETEAVDGGPAAIRLISSGSTFNVIFIDMHLTGMKAPEVSFIYTRTHTFPTVPMSKIGMCPIRHIVCYYVLNFIIFLIMSYKIMNDRLLSSFV